jgi:hypothetical protein
MLSYSHFTLLSKYLYYINLFLKVEDTSRTKSVGKYEE